MTTIGKFFVLIVTVLSIMACKHAEEASASTQSTSEVVSIFDEQGNPLIQITNPKSINGIKEVIQKRQRTMVKILPIFTHQVELQNGELTERWLLNKKGYMKQAGMGDQSLYIIANPSIILSQLD